MNRKLRWGAFIIALILLSVSLFSVPTASAHTAPKTSSVAGAKQTMAIAPLSLQRIAQLEKAMQQYHATRLTRQGHLQKTSANAYSSCIAGSYIQQQWWGFTAKLSHCFTQNEVSALNLDAAINGTIGGLCGLSGNLWCAAPATAFGAFVFLNSAYISALDTWCGNQGVFINVDWQGDVWAAGVCW